MPGINNIDLDRIDKVFYKINKKRGIYQMDKYPRAIMQTVTWNEYTESNERTILLYAINYCLERLERID
jgi:hypothetical protein